MQRTLLAMRTKIIEFHIKYLFNFRLHSIGQKFGIYKVQEQLDAYAFLPLIESWLDIIV
jgi:ribonucleotide reductase beta subunit family protein with ferritin-like domain